MNAQDLLRIFPYAGINASVFAAPLTDAMARFRIDTPARQAAFLAQLGHESSQLNTVEENFNYKPQAILNTFNAHGVTRFTPAQAQQYGRTIDHPANQQMIANIAYANRHGNGDVDSGDGWTFRGAGLIQLTFRANHEACADFFGVPRANIGAWLRRTDGAALSAARFWREHGLNDLADAGDFDGITLRINGGLNGRDERLALWGAAKHALGLA